MYFISLIIINYRNNFNIIEFGANIQYINVSQLAKSIYSKDKASN